MKQKIANKDLRVFAYIWAFIFFIIAIYPLYKSGFSSLLAVDSLAALQAQNIEFWSLYVCLGFFVLGTLMPKLLTWFYKAWVKIGDFIGGVISKIILLILFYAMFTPISLVLKILRKDLLHKKIDKKSPSYWIKRDMQPGSLKNQF